MSLFAPFNSPLFHEFRPLLRALNDHHTHPSDSDSHSTTTRAFSPNFDVHETPSAYILEGEVPGLSEKDKSNLDIEFTDDNTLLIRGKIERSYQASSGDKEKEDKKEKEKESHKATVEDEPEGQVAKTSEKKEVAKKSEAQPGVRYWVSERSIGSFQRSFTFPGLIDQEAVTAKLKDGVLTITVPKRQQPQGKRITVN